MLYSETDECLINMTLKDASDMLHGKDNSLPGYFTREVLFQIPEIRYSGLTEKESENVARLIRELLYISKMENRYNEVSITFDLEKALNEKEDYVCTLGDETSVPFCSDPNTARLLRSTNRLVIVNLHNHPNNSGVFIKDAIAFAIRENIKLMAVVNHKGEVSYLLRNKCVDLTPCIASALEMFNGDEEGVYIIATDMLSLAERKEFKTRLFKEFAEHGVEYQPYISKADYEKLLEAELEEQYEDKQ